MASKYSVSSSSSLSSALLVKRLPRDTPRCLSRQPPAPSPWQCRACHPPATLLPSPEWASLSASCPGSLPPSGSFSHLPKCWPVARLPFPGAPVTSEPQVRWAATWHPGGLATGLVFGACARHGGAGARAGNRCGQEGCASGGPQKPSQLAEGTPREQGGWTGARSPSLKLLLGLAARPGALRKARSRLLCCLASCSMVSSRWTRCSCSYCRARCHFRLCVSASSRKSLQAWGGGWGVAREQREARGVHPQRAQKYPRCPLCLSWRQETPGFLRASLASALVGSPHLRRPSRAASWCGQQQPALWVFLRAGPQLSAATPSLCAGLRFVTTPSPLEPAHSWQPGPDPDLGAEGRKATCFLLHCLARS